MLARGEMADRTWNVADAEAGLRSISFWRRRIGWDRGRGRRQRRERGKVFVNGAEAGQADVRLRLKAGDEVRVWEDRPGSARRRASPFTSGPLRILYEDPVSDCARQAGGAAGRSSRTARRGDFHLRSDRGSSAISWEAQAAGGSPDRSRHVGSRGVCQGRADACRVEAAVQSADAGARISRRGLWPPDPCVGNLARPSRVGHEGADPEGNASKDPRAAEAISQYRVVESFESTSLVEVRLTTGKRNQIRIQARLRGHTLVGEVRYTFGPDELRPIPFKRQALHAWRLTL